MTTAAVGGTFDILHAGHKALLKRALTYDHTIIGLSTDGFAARRGKDITYGYDVRLHRLLAYLDSHGLCSYEVCPLEDDFGPATLPSIDVIVVSEETLGAAHTLNHIRQEAGHRPVDVAVVPIMYGADGTRISTTNIRNGVMDADGNAP